MRDITTNKCGDRSSFNPDKQMEQVYTRITTVTCSLFEVPRRTELTWTFYTTLNNLKNAIFPVYEKNISLI